MGHVRAFKFFFFSCFLVLAFVSQTRSVLTEDADATGRDTNGTTVTNNILATAGAAASYNDGTIRGSLILYNGRIHTMDSQNRVVSVIGIRDGWIVYTGDNLGEAERKAASGQSPARKINLRRRTTIPGLIDCHNHIVLLGNRPGYHTPLENAFTIDEALHIYSQRASDVPTGSFITTIGGFAPTQFQENRLPTLSELDSAVPDHPVFISTSFSGPATTNSLGKAFFESLPGSASVTVAANGSIVAGPENGKALLSLRQRLTFADRVRSARDAMAYAASVGVTTHLDQGAFPATSTPADGAGSEDLFSMHLPFLSVYNSLSNAQPSTSPPAPVIRLRINYLHSDSDLSLPGLTARLQHSYPFFGNAMVRTGGIGEFAVAIEDYAGGEVFEAAAGKVARAGWRLEVHSLTEEDFKGQIKAFERVHGAVAAENGQGITGLRWVVAHVPRITGEYLNKLKVLGGGVNLSGWMYLAGGDAGNETMPAGPPFRRIVESGIPAGFGADGANIAPLSPWPHAYYASTGRNARGKMINPGQTIERKKVLELYTRDNTWFLGGPDEKLLGVLEVGRLGDVAVLSDDYFGVEDDKLKRLRSVLTVVGGVVVHDSRELQD